MRLLSAPNDRAALSAEGLRVPRWLALLSGLVGAILGIATNLYSDEFRRAITASGETLSPVLISVLLTTAVTSTSTTLVYRWLVRRRHHTELVDRRFTIGSDALEYVRSESDLVVGRSLHYLETKRESPELLVFLHGLGLDAYDFQPYMTESRFHCVALTLYGFNVDDKDDEHYKPISLESHVQLVAYALHRIHRRYPRKRISVVGFSFGADIILFLTRFAAQATKDLHIHKAILLDPNINRTTTLISSRVAEVDDDQPLEQLLKILASAVDIREFRYLCEYLYKITAKNFAHIRQHAQDVIAMWETGSYDKFLDRIGQLIRVTKEVHIALSFNYEDYFNPVAREAVERGLDLNNLECSRSDHFDLIEPRFLKDRLEGLLWQPTQDHV